MEAMSRREKILKWMLLLSALLFAGSLPMQGQKQGSDYVLHIRHLDTYYVYNGWGLLSHVLPPGASASMGSDGSYGAENAALANYGYTYTYDDRGFLTESSYSEGNGRKLRATYRTALENVSEPLSSSTQSTAKALVETVRDYVGDAVYENGELVRVLTPEGYVEKSGSGYAHYYYIRDYQGNVRVVADATGAVKEENGYYPFGMLHGGDGGIQPYKYNGKELDRMHGLEWYDYGARMYNGYRFTTPDPLSERYYSTSPYAYCLNNPVLHVDRDGKKVYYASNVSNEFKNDFKQAVLYLNENGMGYLLAELQASDKIYYIEEGKPLTSSKFNTGTQTIIWSSRTGLLTNNAFELSPATILNHEIDHAVQFDRNRQQQLKDAALQDKDYGNKEERRVITGSEQKTARALGEIGKKEVTRSDHYGTLYETTGPTKTEIKSDYYD